MESDRMDVSDIEEDAYSSDEEGGMRMDEIYIPPAPKAVCSFESKGPRLIITHIDNENFKSYAGKTTLGPFHSSFNAIVGPNGSGKSNVIDSMLFVFGYRSTKIRSKKVSVLIHKSERYQNCESCSVVVHFAKAVDLEENNFKVLEETRFSIGRKAFLDNSSFYTLNDRRVPFKTIAKLLRSNGIDLDHNRFLILQGEVEQIALMKPKGANENECGLLEFLEDIIGTSRFKEPIEQVSSKLSELTASRMEKIQKVRLIEKEKNILEGPKKEAVCYLKTENKIATLTNCLMQKYMKDNLEMINHKEQEILQLQQMYNEKSGKLEEVCAEKNNLEQKISVFNKELDCLEGKKDKLTMNTKNLKGEGATLTAEIKNASEEKLKTINLLTKEKKKLTGLEAVPEKNRNELQTLEKREAQLLVEKNEEEKEQNKVWLEIKTEVADLCEKKNVLQNDHLKLREAVDSTKSKYELATAELDMLILPEKAASEKLQQLRHNLEDARDKTNKLKKDEVDLINRLQVLKSEFIKAQKLRDNLVSEEEVVGKELHSRRLNLEETKAAMETTRSHNKVANFLTHCKEKGHVPGFFGRLGDLGAIDKKYDVAVSTACGQLNHMVVDTVETAQHCIELLRQHSAGKASFIPLDRQEKFRETCSTPIKTPENVPRLFDLIKVEDGRVSVAFYFALRDTLVAENMAQASRIAFGTHRFRVVTLKGEIIEMSGTMSGGGKTVQKGSMGQSVVARCKKGTAQDVDMLEMKLRELKNKHASIAEQLRELEAIKLPQAQQQYQSAITELEKTSSQVKDLENFIPLTEKQVKEQEKQLIKMKPNPKEVSAKEAILEKAKKEYEKATDNEQIIRKQVELLNNEIESKTSGKMKAARSKLDEVMKNVAKLQQEKTKLIVGISTAERNMVKSRQKIREMESRIKENESFITSALEKQENLEKLDEDVLNQLAEVLESINKKKKDVSNVKEQLSAIIKIEFEEKSKVQEVENEIDLKRRAIAECKSKLPSLKKRISALKIYEIPGEKADVQLPTLTAEELDVVNVKELQYELSVLEGKLETEKKPNFAAIENYLAKEAVFLERVKELDEATEKRERVRKFYEDVRKRRLEEFMAGYNVISQKLKEMYQTITVGGNAEFEVDTLDPFIEGVTFSVRPPQKSWKSITNLSGGEKTLSSLALVFALHYYKPSPLFVMDEIDAALDFKNVSIIGNYIKERTKNAQFIVISLRTYMFELAQRLIGIYKINDCTGSICVMPQLFDAIKPSNRRSSSEMLKRRYGDETITEDLQFL